MSVLLQLFLMFVCGFVIGGTRDRKHQKRLEKDFAAAEELLTDISSFPEGVSPDLATTLVASEVVIAEDYLKGFLAGLRALFGGEVRSYRSLMKRARQEALWRLILECRSQGLDAICNLRIETVIVGKKSGVCVMAYGTAYKRSQGLA
jgi:uncharacterized protein YbjQ (UPF0145 family)